MEYPRLACELGQATSQGSLRGKHAGLDRLGQLHTEIVDATNQAIAKGFGKSSQSNNAVVPKLYHAYFAGPSLTLVRSQSNLSSCV
jgi:hypothetical protein